MIGMARPKHWFDPPDATDRRRWAVPAGHGRFRGVDLDLLDLDDEAERALLIDAEHPEFARAVDRGQHQVTQRGQTVDPGLHLAIHRVAQTRLWDDVPASTWQTAQRLTRLGYDRHVVLHMIMSVISDETYAALTGGPALTQAEVEARLDALPSGWPPPEDAVAH